MVRVWPNVLSMYLRLCRDMGFFTKNCHGYVGYAEVGKGKDMLGILGHLDVVPPGSDWSRDPFIMALRHGKVIGRGVLDDKGPMVACIFAIKDLIDEGAVFNKRVRLVFGTDEERDWEDMDYYVENEEQPSFGFTPDGDFPVINGEKGMVHLRLSMDVPNGLEYIYGGEATNMVADRCKAGVLNNEAIMIQLKAKGKAAHGSTPEAGENAISVLMKNLIEMKRTGYLSEKSALRSFIDFYEVVIGKGNGIDGEGLGIKTSDELSGVLTLNVGTVNLENGAAILEVDVRYPVTADYEELLAAINSALQPWSVGLEEITHMKPIYIGKDEEFIQNLLKVYRDVTGREDESITIGGATFARAMDNIVAFGPLLPGREDTAHRRDEYIYLSDLQLLRKIYKEAIRAVAVET